MTAWLACVLLLGQQPIPGSVAFERSQNCMRLARAAASVGLDPALVISVAYVESGFKSTAVSSVGAVGMLQILPRYFCPGGKREGCDTVCGGFRALRAWVVDNPKGIRLGLCHYNCGNRCFRSGLKYADRILRYRGLVRPFFLGYRLPAMARPRCVE